MGFSDEESVDLRDVSSDVEMNPDELDALDDSDDEQCGQSSSTNCTDSTHLL